MFIYYDTYLFVAIFGHRTNETDKMRTSYQFVLWDIKATHCKKKVLIKGPILFFPAGVFKLSCRKSFTLKKLNLLSVIYWSGNAVKNARPYNPLLAI